MSFHSRTRTCAAIAIAVVSSLVGAGAADGPSTTVLDVPGRSNATPWVAASGTFVAVAWGAAIDGKTDVFVSTSDDGGRSFGGPVQVNRVAGEARLGGELPPRIALHRRDEGQRPDIAVLWTARGPATEIKTARSRDGGRTFDEPVALQTRGAAGDRGWPALSIDADGIAHAVWLDHRGLAARRAATAASAPGAGAHAHEHTKAATHDGVAMAQCSSLFHASSGTATTTEVEITNSVCYCCKTSLAIGPDGAIYAAWRHVYPGDLRDIALAVSRDGGRSFTPPARVSEDGWAINGCPDDGPSVAVDAKGTIHVVWPTVIGADEPEGALFYATSRDGVRFTPRVRVPTSGGRKPTHPQVAIGPKGRVVVSWDDSVAGQRVAAMREVIHASAGDVRFGEVVTIAAGAGVNHPVVAATDTSLVAVWATGGASSRVEFQRVSLP